MVCVLDVVASSEGRHPFSFRVSRQACFSSLSTECNFLQRQRVYFTSGGSLRTVSFFLFSLPQLANFSL